MYYKKVNYNSNQECFWFLVRHYEYSTLNSWNGLKSIANNVKVYNILEIENDSLALQALEADGYFTINQAIKDWEEDHPGFEVGFNGRSGGYLVLYPAKGHAHCFDTDPVTPCKYDNYDDWKKDVQEAYGSLKAYHSELIYQVKIVQEFDQLCDDLVALTNSLVEDMLRRDSLTKKYSATLRFQRFYYETLEDLKLHMLDMKRRGYSVWEYSDTDLYAEYEMNEAIDSEIVLDQEGDEEFVYEK